MPQQSLFEKIWQAHQVRAETPDQPGVLYIDLHLIHEVTTPQAFAVLKERGLKVRRPDRTLATMDHSTPTLPMMANGRRPFVTDQAADQVSLLEENCEAHGIELHGWDSANRGIVHVMGPELGATQPGMTIVCGDSHTSTHGAFGALAFGIGTTEVGHVLAAQCLLQRKPKSLAVEVVGMPGPGVTAKDVILSIIGHIGVNGGTGHVIEYRGPVFENMTMEQRMTVCNMSIEAGARAGLIAPDDTTFEYLKGRPKAPTGEAWDKAVAHWRTLTSDEGAHFDQTVRLDASTFEPSITYGTNPGMVVPITQPVPDHADDTLAQKALEYMGVEPGKPLLGHEIDVVFIGSCTNSRLSDLRDAAAVMAGRKVADGVTALIVPGSEQVKVEAEAEGLHEIFLAAGAQWREAGCSMCIGMNGDTVAAGKTAVSTSNRNFEGRQGKGARTMLASPATAAAAAVTGKVTDPRGLELLGEAS